MVYTCAYFTEDHTDIERAQRDKLDMICRKLRLQARRHVASTSAAAGARWSAMPRSITASRHMA